MTRIAALFPGQGSQFVGMGADLVREDPVAAEVFSTVDHALGFPLSEICFHGPQDALKMTENTQPALLAHSIAAWRMLHSAGLEVDGFAGHSLGEYSAIVAARGMDLAVAARTVRLRGRLMQQAVPVGEGAMAAVLGLDDEAVIRICTESSIGDRDIVAAVNFNAPGQVVIAGGKNAVDRAVKSLKEAGARRALPLPVSAPFHSPLMAPAREGLTPTLEAVRFSNLEKPLYRNIDARPVTLISDLREGLVRQVDAPVLWTDTIRRMAADGFDTFIEIGAGKVLSGLIRRISRDLRCFTAGDPDDIRTVMDQLKNQEERNVVT